MCVRFTIVALQSIAPPFAVAVLFANIRWLRILLLDIPLRYNAPPEVAEFLVKFEFRISPFDASQSTAPPRFPAWLLSNTESSIILVVPVPPTYTAPPLFVAVLLYNLASLRSTPDATR